MIPQNTERYISFSLKEKGRTELRFLYSYAFMMYSLDNLVKNLKEFPIVDKYFTEPNGKKLLRQKGSFPYEWFDDFSKLENKKLPKYKYFKSSLKNNKNILSN